MFSNADARKDATSSQQVMQKDPSRQDQHKPGLSLPRSKILRGKKNFQRLFEKSTILSSNSLHFRYRLYQNPDEGCLIGFIAPKKKIKSAVHRNRIKRVMREAYRINQGHLQDLCVEKRFGLHGAFVANSSEITFKDAESDTVAILQNLRESLLHQFPAVSTDAGESSQTSNAETKQS